jgi:hypothetical protein
VNTAAWTFLAAGLTVVGTLTMFFVSRRHRENLEDNNALSGQITALGDAAVKIVNTSTNVSEFVQSMLTPLQERMTFMQAEINELKRSNQDLDIRMTHVIDYVRMLRQQVRDSGLEPHPPPGLLEDFPFD